MFIIIIIIVLFLFFNFALIYRFTRLPLVSMEIKNVCDCSLV